MHKIALLTDRRYIDKNSESGMPEAYVANVLQEDRLVLEACRRAGLDIDRIAWCNPSAKWNDYRAALFRTTWDYFDRWPAFSSWLEQVSSQTVLFNSKQIVSWNLDKHYLRDLEIAGVSVVPTAFVPKNTAIPLFEVASRRKWREVVIKPAVAGAARDTYWIDLSGSIHVLSPEPPDGRNSEHLWHALVSKQDMLVQPFLPDVIHSGELSLIWIDGEITHAVRKKAKSGDFRVQDDHGGTVHAVAVDPELSALGKFIMTACLNFCRERGWDAPLYARIDLMKDQQNRWLLSELELVEPELWFRHQPKASDLLAQAVKNRLEQA